MKKKIFTLLFVAWTGAAFALESFPAVSAPQAVTAGPHRCPDDGRHDISLSGDGWTADGDPVCVPHTWNAEDAADGIGRVEDWVTAGYSSGATSYVRKVITYRRALPNPVANKRYFVKCLGASMKAEVKVNGVSLGRHLGAFTAFCFEATDALKPSGNELEIIVDNRFDPDLQPINADFSVYGGLYRDVRWIETEKVCIDPVTDGACGVTVDADPASGEVIAHVRVLGGTNEVRRFRFDNPKPWSPETPNLYTLNVEVSQRGCVDSVPVRFGFRTAEFREDGFYLNGKKRKIRGVCRHQDREGKGWAVSAADEAEDVMLIKSMGADGVRTSHYPQSSTFYDLCDEKGLLVWTEVPNVNKLTFTDAAVESERTHVREMIAQHRNHPCVFAWGISNELYNRKMPGELAEERMEALRDYAKSIDPSRTIVQAGNHLDRKRLNAVPEQLGLNLYPGWYGMSSDRMGEKLDEAFRLNDRKIVAVTEYGGGGCIGQHDDPDLSNDSPRRSAQVPSAAGRSRASRGIPSLSPYGELPDDRRGRARLGFVYLGDVRPCERRTPRRAAHGPQRQGHDHLGPQELQGCLLLLPRELDGHANTAACGDAHDVDD